MDNESIQDAIDYCCGNPDGLDTEELLSKFPKYRDELVPLLAVCNLISDVPRVPTVRYEAMKQRVMAAAGARQAAQSEPRPQAAPSKAARVRFNLDWLKRPALVAGALVILMVSFVWSASASSLPDSPFYNVKLLAENATIVGSPTDKALRHEALAEERLNDLQKMQQQRKLDKAGLAFSNYDEHLRQSQELLNGITGPQKAEVAGALYRTCRRGQVEFNSFAGAVAQLPAPVKKSYSASAATQDALSLVSANVLVSFKILPLSKVDRATLDVLQKTPGPEATQIAALDASSTGTTLATGAQSTTLATGTTGPTQPPAMAGDFTPTYEPGGATGVATGTASGGASATDAATAPPPLASPTNGTPTVQLTPGETVVATGTATIPAAVGTSVASSLPTQAPSQTAELANTQKATSTPGGATATLQADETSTAQPTRPRPVDTATPKSTPVPQKTATSTRTATHTVTPTANPPRPPSHTPVPVGTRVPPADVLIPPTTTPYPPSATPILPVALTATPTQTPVLPIDTPAQRARPSKTPTEDAPPPSTRVPRASPEPTEPPKATKPPKPTKSIGLGDYFSEAGYPGRATDVPVQPPYAPGLTPHATPLALSVTP